MKKISQRLLTDPIFVIYVVGKKLLRYWPPFFIGTTLGIMTATGQNKLEVIRLSLVICLAMPCMYIFFFVVLASKETFFREVEDLVHVVRPNFSFRER